jgi:O-methyltransferase
MRAVARALVGRSAKRLAGAAGYEIVRRPSPSPPPTKPELPPDFDEIDRDLWANVSPYTMTPPERIYTLRRAVEHVAAAKIPGAIVECGVWKGGSMMAVASTLLRIGDTSRGLYLFDTFEGMSEPSDADLMYTGQHAAALLATHDRTSRVWGYAPFEGVRETMIATGYDQALVHFVKGKVEDTIPEHAPLQIALLRLDTDWYESTRHELEHLYPRLASGGVLIVDDYGHWQGARKAVDEYLKAQGLTLLLQRIDYTARLALKP